MAERMTLKRLLSEIPGEDVLDRSGLQARLEDVENELAASGPPRSANPARRLTFRGRPVVGQHGIFAEFGAKATSSLRRSCCESGGGAFRAAGRHGADSRIATSHDFSSRARHSVPSDLNSRKRPSATIWISKDKRSQGRHWN